MKKILLALAALASASSLFAGYANWFTATPDAETPTWEWTGEDGSIITNTTATTPYWEIDADVTKAGGDDATLFTPTTSATRDNTVTIVDIKTTFDAMYDMSVGGEDAPLAPPDGSLGALIVGSVTNEQEQVTSSNFYAYVNSAWVPLYGAEVPSCLTGDVVNVRIELLYMGSASAGVNKLRYSVLSDDQTPVVTVLTNAAGVSLFEFNPGSTKQLAKVQFSGCGKVTGIESKVRDTEFFDGGSGSEDDPYLISSPDSFLEIGVTGKYSSGNWLKFMDNFTLKGFAPIFSTAEAANVQGNNKTITVELTGNSFFGNLYSCTIKDLTINASNASDNDDPVAVFASSCDGVTFENCTAAGTLHNTKASAAENPTALAGFALAANATDAAAAAITFKDCTVTATLDNGTTDPMTYANCYAFVADITQGIVTNAADTVLATVNGYESYGTIASAGESPVAQGAVACAFNFCTNGVGDFAAYSFYVVPEILDPAPQYYVKKANSENFYFEANGMLKLYNPDLENPPEYLGEVTAHEYYVVDKDTTADDHFTYTIGNCVAQWIHGTGDTETNKYMTVAAALTNTSGTVELYTKNPAVTEWSLDADATVAAGVTFDLKEKDLDVADGKTLTIDGGTLCSYTSCMGDVVLGNNSTNVIRYVEDSTVLVSINDNPWVACTNGAPDDAEAEFAHLGAGCSMVMTKIGENANCYYFESSPSDGSVYIHWDSDEFAPEDTFEVGLNGYYYFDGDGVGPNLVLNKFSVVPDYFEEQYYTLSYTKDDYENPCYDATGISNDPPPYQVASGKKFCGNNGFANALLAAGDNGTIIMLADFYGDQEQLIDQDITLNLNGHDLIVQEGGTLEIAANVTVTGDGQIMPDKEIDPDTEPPTTTGRGTIEITSGTLDLSAFDVAQITGGPEDGFLIASGATLKTASGINPIESAPSSLNPVSGAFLVSGSNAYTYDGSTWKKAGASLDGEGTEEDPWLIKTADDLKLLNDSIAAQGEYAVAGAFFKQTADIDMAGVAWEGIGVYINTTDTSYAKAFKGVYDGNGKRITNLAFLGNREYGALFNIVTLATIKNLTVELAADSIVNKSVDSYGFAAIVGWGYNNVTLQNITVKGNLGSLETPTTHNSGGIAVDFAGPNSVVVDCTNEINIVSKKDKFGGIIGFNGAEQQDASHPANDVTCQRCVNKGTMTIVNGGGNTGVGQIIGWSKDDITMIDCEANGSVVDNTGAAYVGSLIGKFAGSTNPRVLTVSGCTTTEIDKPSLGLMGDKGSATGIYYATVDAGVATFIPEGSVRAGTNYKVMTANAPAVTLEKGTAIFDGTLLDTYTADNVSCDENINTIGKSSDAKVITCTVTPKTPADDVYAVDGDANTGNVKIESSFVTSLDGCSGFDTPEKRAANAATIQAQLNAKGANDIPQWMNYAMGLSTAAKKAGENDKPIAAAKQDANPNSIKLSLAGLNPPANIGAKIRYEVSGISGAEPKEYGEDLDINISALGFDASHKFKAITIKVIVDQTNAEAKK